MELNEGETTVRRRGGGRNGDGERKGDGEEQGSLDRGSEWVTL